MYKFFSILFFLSCSQDYICVDDVGELINNSIKCEELSFKTSSTGDRNIYKLDEILEVSLTKNNDRENLIVLNGKIIKIDTKIINKKIIFDLMTAYEFKWNNINYISLELNSNNGLNLNSKSLNIVVKITGNYQGVCFSEWNSGYDLSSAIGVNNDKLFILNQDVNYLNYFEFKKNIFMLNKEKSTKCKIDEEYRICVPHTYKI
jgi:hypothetical protein